MQLDRKILECEHEYTKCFSEFSEDENVMRFRDHQLKDMYFHNYTYIENLMDEVELKRIIEKEIAIRQSEKSSFCNVLFTAHLDNALLSMFEIKPEKSRSGFYSFDFSYYDKLKTRNDCIVKKVENQEMIEHLLYCNLQEDEAHLDFTDPAKRIAPPYKSNFSVKVVFPASGWEIIAKDLLLFTSSTKLKTCSDILPLPLYKIFL